MDRARSAAAAVAALGVTALSATAWSLVQSPRRPSLDPDALWEGASERLAVVLGVGGAPGVVWQTALLARLIEMGALDPEAVHLVVGTSAGSVVAALLRSGLPHADMLELVVSGRLSLGDAAVTLPVGTQGPWGQTVHAASSGRLPHLTSALAGFLPPPGFSLDALGAAVDQVWAAHHPFASWPARPTWLTAVDTWNGQRVVFGAPGEPCPPLALAVRASCAVPGLFPAVQFDGHSYVDGALASFASVDLAVAAGARRIVVLNPSAGAASSSDPLGRAVSVVRRWEAARFHRALRHASASGVSVAAFTPTPEEFAAMGERLLDFERGPQIVEAVARRPLDPPQPS